MPERAVGGRRVAWREAGGGEPALLLHCGLAHSGAFGPLMARLGDRLAMRALDLPGHGGTDWDPDRDIQDQALEDARAMLAETGPAHVIGHSFGGTVALRLGVEAPGLVRSLTLIEPVMFAFLADAGHPGYEAEIAAEGPFHDAVRAGDWAAAAEAFLGRWGAGPPRDASQAAYVLGLMPFVAESGPGLGDPARAKVRTANLARVVCPILLVAGTESPPIIGTILDAIAAARPDARRVVVAGAGHMAPVTHPEAVSGALRDFLALDEG
jgi:lipase